MRIVLDTNVFVSGLISPNGPPGRVLAEVKREGHVLITSAEQISELRRVLGGDYLQSRIRRDEAEDLLRNLEAVAEVVTDLPDVTASTDADDNVIPATAIAGRADLIVSGDKKHMLILGQIEGIPLVTAADAAALLPTSSNPW